MNCAEMMYSIVSELKAHSISSLCDIEYELEDEWDKDYAVVLIHLDEEDYRDYDRVTTDIVEKLYDGLSEPATKIYGTGKEVPKNGYVLHIWEKSNGLTLEIELYRVKPKKSIKKINS